MRYLKKFFFAENIVISFVGDVPISKLTKILEKDFGPLKHSAIQIKPKEYNSYNTFKIRTKEANFQAHAIIGGLAPGYNDEHRRGMTLLTNVLGGPALNSRLILSIREKYGYTYNIEASYSPYADIGYWSIYFGTDQKYLEKTLKQVYKEIKLMYESALNEHQLHKAKIQLKGQLALSLESNSGIMQGLGKSLLLFNQIDSIQEIYAGIDKLSVQDLKDISHKYFDEKNISELVFEVGDD
jgi:predicted Zn-dependent peptidase